jgi:hypothetical protein
MRIGAKIMLSTGLDGARDGLASLADCCWMMTLPQRGAYHHGHPAGRGRPGLPESDAGAGLVAVTFGPPPESPGAWASLSVHWESVELGDTLTVLLAGDITPAPAAVPGHTTLALTGFCRLLPAIDGGGEQARMDLLKEAARSFITSVAVAVGNRAEPGRESQPPGPASAWVNGRP